MGLAYIFYRSVTKEFGSFSTLLFLSFSNYSKFNSDLDPSSFSIKTVPCFFTPGWLLSQWGFQCFPRGKVFLLVALHSPQILSTYLFLSRRALYVAFSS